MKLDIILRTCQNSRLDANLAVNEPQFVRICGKDRQQMIFRCFMSLINAINNTQLPQVELTVLDDHSDVDFVRKVKALLKRCNKPAKLITLEKEGPNNSAYEQFYIASRCTDLVYSVEDDYLHDPDAINSMVNAYYHFKNLHPNEDVTIFPFDCPFRYELGRESTTKLYHDGNRYWRQVAHTTNTFLASASQLRKHFHVYKTLALEYPKVMEEDTINKLYVNYDTNTGIVRAFNPIPSCAYHLSYQEPSEIRTSHASWKHLWDSSLYLGLFEGWFNYEQLYYNVAPKLQDNATIVEVGSYLGRSIIGIANYNKRIGKRCKIYAVDTWEGSLEQKHFDTIAELKEHDHTLYDEFLMNLEVYGVKDVIAPIRKTSEEASKDFEDGSLDLVIIDAAHDYENVTNDIKLWLPKVKRGGIVIGDDYSDSWQDVKRAVKDYFGEGNYNVFGGVWYKIIE